MPWKRSDLPSDAEERASQRERARFLVDEGLDESVADVLGELGWKAVWVDALAPRRPANAKLLAYALKHDLVLLTQDRVFLDDAKFPGQESCGVIVLPGGHADGTALRRGIAIADWLFGPYRDAWRRFKCEISGDGEMTISTRHADTGKITTDRYRFTASWPPLEWVDENES
jgi:hypothetical protein